MTNASVFLHADCVKRDPDVNEKMEKSFTELHMEELMLREAETIDDHRRADC